MKIAPYASILFLCLLSASCTIQDVKSPSGPIRQPKEETPENISLWYEEEFEATPVSVAEETISGSLATSTMVENSAWAKSQITYTPMTTDAFSGTGFQRAEMKEGPRLELLRYEVPGGPGTFFEVKIAVRGTPGTEVDLVLSNPKTPVWGDPWMTLWSRKVPLTREWTEHRFILPDAKVPDSLRFGINLNEPGVLDMDALQISVMDKPTAMSRLQRLNFPVPYALQHVDGTAESQPTSLWPGRQADAELTAADIRGPDGLIYPDFRYAGIPGGIPEVPVVVHARTHGAIPDDDIEDQQAIMKALDAAAEKGGGAVLLEAGEYLLGGPVLITHHNVVLRGAGMDKTHLINTYQIPHRSLSLVSHDKDDVVGLHDILEVHADPNGLQDLQMTLNGHQLASFGATSRRNGQYWIRRPLFTLLSKYPDLKAGPATVRVFAKWKDGQTAEHIIPVQLDPQLKEEGPLHFNHSPAGIRFTGDQWSHKRRRWSLAKDLKRGESVVTFDQEPPLQAGDILYLTIPSHPDFIDRIRSARPDIPRGCIFIVHEVEGAQVTLNQPARIDYPADQGARGQTLYPITNSGIEDLTYSQRYKHWTHGIVMDTGYRCWMRNIKVNKAGRNPIDVQGSKQMEVRDSEFNDAWYLGGGGTGYVTFTATYDCLMENLLTRRLRHAPNAQWGAQGNVFRNSTFIQSDAQFHMGWAVENLFENCTIDAEQGTGSYGYGLFVQRPEVSIHGPGGGPRNVIYNNRFRSPKSGVLLGGSNEGWMILYNDFDVENGPGMIFHHGVFDTIVKGNFLNLRSSVAPAFRIVGEAPGIQLLQNTIISEGGVLFDGSHPPLTWKDNLILNNESVRHEKPEPPVASIFEWQRKNLPEVGLPARQQPGK